MSLPHVVPLVTGAPPSFLSSNKGGDFPRFRTLPPLQVGKRPALTISGYPQEDPWAPAEVCRGDIVFVDRSTGERYRPRCKAYGRCVVCARFYRREIIRALILAKPEFSFMVTLAGTDWLSVQKTMQRLRRYLQDHADPFAYGWVVEDDHRDSGQLHVHAAARGPVPDREVFDTALRRAGAGGIQNADLDPIRTVHGYSAYMVKAVKNAGKVPRGTAEVRLWMHLVLNGNRLVHATHGFWMTANGNPATLEEVRRSGTPARNQNWFIRLYDPLPRPRPRTLIEFG